MKIIGISKEGYDPTYIVEVSHSELQAAFEKGYSNELTKMKTGDSIDLRTIPNQRVRIVEATEKMQKAYEEFVKAAPAMTQLAMVIQKESQP